MTVFNLFCIGTAHTQKEPNQTMVQLYQDCTSPPKFKMLVDGPKNGWDNLYLAEASGWGMDKNHLKIVDRICAAGDVSQVNMAGHSRGGVLCHMVARKLSEYNRVPVNIAALDPVHMSKGHGSVAQLPDTVQKYQAIIMENANSSFFPLQKVDFDEEDRGKAYYVNMPGTHGSGTQVLTSAIGKVCYELIANFMRKRKTEFNFAGRNAFEMCALFAKIHEENGWTDAGRTRRTIFDDYGDAAAHDTDRETVQGYQVRAPTIADRLAYNLDPRRHDADLPGGGLLRKDFLMAQCGSRSYFINQKHAKFFKKAFPHLWQIVAWQRRIYPWLFKEDLLKMSFSPALVAVLPLLGELIRSRMPQGCLLWDQAVMPTRPAGAPLIGRARAMDAP